MGEDASPFNEKLDDAMSFPPISSLSVVSHWETAAPRSNSPSNAPTSDRASPTTSRRTAIRSPTIRDMMDVFEDMVDDPEEFVVRSDEEAGRSKRTRRGCSISFVPSRTTVATPISVKNPISTSGTRRSSTLIPSRRSVDSSTALTMQLLISLVYERAKVSEKEVVFYIDEARYIMQDAASLAFLETVFRHHRHHDLDSAGHPDRRRVLSSTLNPRRSPTSVPSSSSIGWTGWTRRGPTSSG